MAITLQQLCENANYLYGMRLVAGEDGMDNIVQWVHTLEDIDVVEFLHGGELIFTTGIAHKDENWLLDVVKRLINSHASGLVINLGPYISEIPKEVVKFSSENGLPLLEVPWKTRLVDITRDFCNQIIQNEKEEENIGNAFKNIIFYPMDIQKFTPVLELNRFDLKGSYCMMAFKMELAKTTSNYLFNIVKMTIMRRIYHYKHKISCFTAEQDMYFVLCNYTNEEVSHIAEELQKMSEDYKEQLTMYIGIGPNQTELKNLNKCYRITQTVLNLSYRKKISPLNYDKFGMKKILLSVDEPEILETYYKEMLGNLEHYDKENGTEYLEMLRKYLKANGSIQKIADETFVHRNTINYQLGKIKSILGNDLSTLEDRFRLMLAYQIYELL